MSNNLWLAISTCLLSPPELSSSSSEVWSPARWLDLHIDHITSFCGGARFLQPVLCWSSNNPTNPVTTLSPFLIFLAVNLTKKLDWLVRSRVADIYLDAVGASHISAWQSEPSVHLQSPSEGISGEIGTEATCNLFSAFHCDRFTAGCFEHCILVGF